MRRGKFCGVFSFAAGIFPCPQKAREKPSAPGSQFVFFLRRRLFKLGRGYNTEASSSELTLSENQDAYLVFKTDGSCFRRDIDYRNYH